MIQHRCYARWATLKYWFIKLKFLYFKWKKIELVLYNLLLFFQILTLSSSRYSPLHVFIAACEFCIGRNSAVNLFLNQVHGQLLLFQIKFLLLNLVVDKVIWGEIQRIGKIFYYGILYLVKNPICANEEITTYFCTNQIILLVLRVVHEEYLEPLLFHIDKLLYLNMI